jgi:carbon monoxide dehydrogenase subunit G
MKISGSATVAHPVPAVFAALTDPAILVRTLPGCQRLEQTGPDSYSATLEAGVGSITGLFDGDVRLSDLAAPGS